MMEFFNNLFSTNQGQRKLIGFGLSVVAVVFILIIDSQIALFEGIEKRVVGFWFFIRYPEARSLEPGVSRLEFDPDVREDIIIAAIDDESVQKIGLWPWPRWTSAELIKVLGDAGARMVVFDVFFISKTNLPENDVFLRESIKNADNVFLNYPFTKEVVFLEGTDKEGAEDSIKNYVNKFSFSPDQIHSKEASMEIYENLTPVLGTFAEVAKGLGHANVEPDQDGVLRNVLLITEYQERFYPSLAFLAALDFYDTPVEEVRIDLGDSIKLRNGVEIPINNEGEMVVDYIGMGKFRYIPFVQIIEGGIPPEFFKDKIVYVGSTSTGAFDLRVTPLGATPGVEYWATVLNNLLNRNFVVPVPDYLDLILLLALGVILGFVFPFARIIISALTFIGAIAVIAAVSFVLFLNGTWLNFTNPFMGVLLSFVSITLYRVMTEQREKRQVHGMFATFVSPDLVEELVKNPDMMKLGGEKRNLTVFFSDVAGFTSISEMLDAHDLVLLLNEYLTAMVNIILEHRGTVDKYEGDAIMAFWGAPVIFEEHATETCHAALEMQEKMIELREKWKAEGKPHLAVRMGINTGEMVAGNMGSQERFDYTVMGDSVNLAARLEPANKVYGTYIMISEYTYEHVKGQFICRELDALQVKGKTEPVKVYELIATMEKGVSEDMEKVLEYYNQGLDLYKNRKWDDAIAKFKSALSVNGSEDSPSEAYVERCEEYKESPPPDNWQGEYIMTSKG